MSWDESGSYPLTGQTVPGVNDGTSPICGFHTERGRACRDAAPLGATGKRTSGGNREASSTVARRAVGPVHSSDEAPVMGVERRGRTVQWRNRSGNQDSPGRDRADQPKPGEKPFDISKREVWEAYQRVAANKGAPGVDGIALEAFEKDLKNNLYRIWNRMSSGSYFPPPVRAVPIPKKGGVRILGVPTIADRIAQTVVARRLEPRLEAIFHADSDGYRVGRSAIDAVAKCRRAPAKLIDHVI